MKNVRSSFLRDLAPSTYDTLSDWKPIALIYAAVLLIFVILSFFFQWSFIKFFIDLLMGWTLLSIPFIGVIIVSLDKEIEMEKAESHWEKEYEVKPKSYLYTKIWGISLCIFGLICLYFSGKYKDYYAFQCNTFYVDNLHHTYHILDDCEYSEIDNDELIEVKGKDLLNTNHELCDACEEWAEDARASAYEWQYRRR